MDKPNSTGGEPGRLGVVEASLGVVEANLGVVDGQLDDAEDHRSASSRRSLGGVEAARRRRGVVEAPSTASSRRVDDVVENS